jgi:hypothetical protein
MPRLFAFCLVLLLSINHFSFSQQTIVPAKGAATAPAATPGVPPAPNVLQDGTAVKLRLAENLTSATAKAGQQVSFEVLEEVDLEGMPVIAKGAQAFSDHNDGGAQEEHGQGWKAGRECR